MWGWCWLASLFSSLPQKNLPPLLPSPRSYFFLFTRLTHLGFFFFLSFLLPFICRYQSTDPEQAYVDEMAHKLAMMQVQGTAQAAVLAGQGQMFRGLQNFSAQHQEQHGGVGQDPSQMMGGGGGYGGGARAAATARAAASTAEAAAAAAASAAAMAVAMAVARAAEIGEGTGGAISEGNTCMEGSSPDNTHIYYAGGGFESGFTLVSSAAGDAAQSAQSRAEGARRF